MGICNKKILIISSSMIDNELLKRDLFNAGYEVASARDAFSGTEMASLLKPDLVLLEDSPADSNLALACSAIRNLHDRPRLVVCTDQYGSRIAKDLGADDVVLQPSADWELMSCIDRNMSSSDQSHESASRFR